MQNLKKKNFWMVQMVCWSVLESPKNEKYGSHFSPITYRNGHIKYLEARTKVSGSFFRDLKNYEITRNFRILWNVRTIPLGDHSEWFKVRMWAYMLENINNFCLLSVNNTIDNIYHRTPNPTEHPGVKYSFELYLTSTFLIRMPYIAYIVVFSFRYKEFIMS